MATFIVTGGRTDLGQPITSTVKADSFSTDDEFIVFKVGSVVIKAISRWQVDSVEMVDPPASKDD